MTITCACCGSVVSIDREVPGHCPLCGRSAWTPGPPQPGRYDVSASDEDYLKTIGIAWPTKSIADR